MAAPRQPIFLARRAYRLRRLSDAARLLPLAGLFLFLVPIFWRDRDSGLVATASAGLYLFAVWALLIAAAFAISHRLRRLDREDAGDEAE